jgi:hypothetical protein
MTIGELRKALKRKVIGSPTGLEPPYLHAMVDNTARVLVNPGTYTEVYVQNLRKDVEEARKVLQAIEQALPTLEKRTSKQWKKRKKK